MAQEPRNDRQSRDDISGNRAACRYLISMGFEVIGLSNVFISFALTLGLQD